MNTARKRFPISLAAAFLLWGVLVSGVLRAPPQNILSWDTFGYHLYLPATFIHHDLGLNDAAWVQEAMTKYEAGGKPYQINPTADGRWVMKYPMGLAILWLPFFLIAHVLAGILGFAQDGFSAPYQWALIIAALVYMLIGIMLLRRVLRHFFSEVITTATLALIVTGTNYFHQAVYSTGMPHVFLFTLGAGVLWFSIRWHKDRRRKDALITGALLGLLVVSRPSEIVWVLVPLLIGLVDAASWKDHLSTLWSRRKHLIIMVAMATLVCVPQLVYWKWMTGKWLYMSYNNPGEGFEFLHPYTWDVLFSFRKGWYIYTPIMLVATLGILLLRRFLPEMRWAVIAFFILNLYIVSSWSCWWYADSFGQRALVQSYPMMALPLGAVLVWLNGLAMRWRITGVAALLALTGLNLFQSQQSIDGLIQTSRMTWPAYKAVFGTVHAPEGLADKWLVERSYIGENGSPDRARYHRIPLARVGYDVDHEAGDTIAFRGNGSFRLEAGREFSPGWSCMWKDLTNCDHIWLEVSCRMQRPMDGSTPPVSLVTTFDHLGDNYGYMARDMDLATVAPGEWMRVSQWYLSPEVRRPTDVLKAYCWLRDTLPVHVDDLEVILYEPIEQP